MKGSKMSTMRTAASDLVNILYGSREQVRNLWVGLVPYTATVNIGPQRWRWLNNSGQGSQNGSATGAANGNGQGIARFETAGDD